MPWHIPFIFYAFWLFINRTELGGGIKLKIIPVFLSFENKGLAAERIGYNIRYVVFQCATCFCFWCNLISALLFLDFTKIAPFFCLTIVVETVIVLARSNGTRIKTK